MNINKLKIILPIIGISLSLYVGFCKKKNKNEIIELTPIEFQKAIESLSDPQIVDVNTFDEYSKNHLKNAWHFDFHSIDFEHNLNKLINNEPVFVYCTLGGRSDETANILIKNDFEKVFLLKGGLSEWMKKGLPIEHN